MTKVEEVARAIYEKNPLWGHRPNLGEGVKCLPWDSIPEHQGDYREQARAAIGAMRELDAKMADALNREFAADGALRGTLMGAWLQGHHAMIDAALAEDR